MHTEEGCTLSSWENKQPLQEAPFYMYIRRSSVSLTQCSSTTYRPSRQSNKTCEPIYYLLSNIHESAQGRLCGQSSSYK